VCALPPVCNPRCRPPQVCMSGNRCEVPQ
jgi:hypothetical protein